MQLTTADPIATPPAVAAICAIRPGPCGAAAVAGAADRVAGVLADDLVGDGLRARRTGADGRGDDIRPPPPPLRRPMIVNRLFELIKLK